MSIEKRKEEHVKICLENEIQSKKATGLENFELIHNPLPEINFDEIKLSVDFFGKRLNYPLQISGMVGGSKESEKINKNLAKAAQKLGIAMGVGSQRAAIENPGLEKTYYVRDVAPDIFLIANLGAVQLNYGYGIKEVKKAVEMISADALALHLNPAQEAIQKEGDKNFSNLLQKIKKICAEADFPIIAKEVGNGISGTTAEKLKMAGVSCIDVQGAGGTSFARVENYRSKTNFNFDDWGISTAQSIQECKKTGLKIIGSGGIRTGVDVAKAIALGADICGIAQPLLKAATKSHEEVEKRLEKIIEELKIAMFLTGSKNLKELPEKIRPVRPLPF